LRQGLGLFPTTKFQAFVLPLLLPADFTDPFEVGWFFFLLGPTCGGTVSPPFWGFFPPLPCSVMQFFVEPVSPNVYFLLLPFVRFCVEKPQKKVFWGPHRWFCPQKPHIARSKGFLWGMLWNTRFLGRNKCGTTNFPFLVPVGNWVGLHSCWHFHFG